MLSAAAIDRRRSRAAGSSGSAVALCLALALVLDTADGRLARLQGTCSAFGRWLDQVLDELADLALHAAIAWAAFVRDGQPDLAGPRHRLRLGEVPLPGSVAPGR